MNEIVYETVNRLFTIKNVEKQKARQAISEVAGAWPRYGSEHVGE